MMLFEPLMYSLRLPLRASRVGTEVFTLDPSRRRVNCASPKKKSLFLIRWPPTEPPNWFHLVGGTTVFSAELKGLRAKSWNPGELLRRNSNAEPWKSLVPDLVETFIMPAPV